MRRHTPLVAALALVALALTATSAFATGEHAVGTPFGGPGSGPGEFSDPAGVAVNEETGDVYVVDKGNDRVEQFAFNAVTKAYEYEDEFNGSGLNSNEGAKTPPTGRFSEPEAIAVDNDPSSESHGDVYVADAGHNVVDKFSATGEYRGQLTEAPEGSPLEELHGVAVDAGGRVWVSQKATVLDRYSEEEPNEFNFGRESEALCCTRPDVAAAIAVDSLDNLYIVNEGFIGGSETSTVAKLNSAGGVIAEDFGGEGDVSALAVEPSSDDVYIDNGATVDRFSGAGGAPLERLGSGLLKSGAGVAVNSSIGGESGGSVYVADATADVVDVFPARKEAGISGEQATNIRETAATLQAEVDPNEYDTTYHFEYDTSPYTSNAPHGTSLPAPDAKLGSGSSPVPVSVELPNLAPGTTYYYRVVTDSDVNGTPTPAYGPDEAFTTPAPPSSAPEACSNAKLRSEQPYGLTLPDCRAYELVSPLNKNDSDVSFVNARASTSDESPALAYLSPGSFSGPKAAPTNGRYISTRGADGWSTQNVSPPRGIVEGGLISPFSELLFTPELSKGVVSSPLFALVEDEPQGLTNLYIADIEDGSYQTVTNAKAPGAVPYEPRSQSSSLEPKAMGASSDLSHVVFQQDASLTAGASPEEDHVYEWANGGLSLVDVPPTGVKFEGEDEVGAPFDVEEVDDGASAWHAVSANGLRVFFTGAEGKEQDDLGQLYVRENPEQPPVDESRCTVSGDACTIEVSASQRTDCNVQRKEKEPGYVCTGTPEPDPHGPQPAYFRDASADGEEVFFTSRAELTNDANTGPADNAANLYEYDLKSGKLTDLTPDTNVEDHDGAAVLNLVTAGEAGFTAGEQGSYVYFVANGVLAAGAKPGNCKQENAEELTGEPTCSLYVEHYNGAGWEAPKFVATLAGGDPNTEAFAGDEYDWVGFEYNNQTINPPGHDWGPGFHTVRVTPDGAGLSFQSERSLTGYNNGQAQAGDCEHENDTYGKETGRCREVYLYDATTAKLVCASCDPSGARPVGPAELGGHEEEETDVARLAPFYLPRNLSEDGQRLFFQSPDALVPHDTNGKLDVYEWEAAGEGSCVQSSGCVLPISDVAGEDQSHFMDASPNGEDVFIATAEQLVPAADSDTRVNVYDVRVGGGFPVTVVPAPCKSECLPPVSPQPSVFAPTGSATFNGLGNPSPAVAPPAMVKPKPAKKTVKCKKPKKLSHGRCVKQKRKKAKKATRASNQRRAER